MGRLGTSTLQANDAVALNPSTMGADHVVGIGLGIYVGVAGKVIIGLRDGTELTYNNVPAGTFMQLPIFRYVAADATATTDIVVAFWNSTKSPS